MSAETTKNGAAQADLTPVVDPAAHAKALQEGRFWKLKYFELQQHTNQIIAALANDFTQTELKNQLAALGVK